MINILFYHANSLLDTVTDNLYIGVVALFLKTYIDNNRPDLSDKIKWLVPEQRKLTDDELLKVVIDKDVDLLCTSHYIWNHTFLTDQLSRIEKHLPEKTQIVVGGPSIDVNTNPDFFKQYPYIDYAVYGSGEVAFADLLDNIINNKKLIAFNTSNLAWNDVVKNRQIVADYKYVPEPKTSPYCHNEKLLAKMFIKERLGNPPLEGKKLTLPYELTRGCPYSCTFCDWNSGLTNKVSRRKETYKDEIDMFQRIGFTDIFLADANIGQYDEDVDVVEYFAKKNIEENVGFTVIGNLSKLRKENNLKIYHALGQGKLHNNFIVSIQDINPTILENIDRPSITWEEYKEVLTELNKTYPEAAPVVQLIQGLPGQTPDTWRNTLKETCQYSILVYPFISELLPASPSYYDPAYQQKFKFVYSDSIRYNTNSGYFQHKFPESCVSFTKEDMVSMTMISCVYSAVTLYNTFVKPINKEQLAEALLQSDIILSLHQNLESNWLDNKFYFTKNFSGQDTVVSACNFFKTGQNWIMDPQFYSFIEKNLS